MPDNNQVSENFVDLFQSAKSVTSRLEIQIHNLLFIDDIVTSGHAPSADTMTFSVMVEDRVFDLPADVLGAQGITQLLEPMAQVANDKVAHLVSELNGFVGRMHKVCFPSGEDIKDGDEKIEIPHAPRGITA